MNLANQPVRAVTKESQTKKVRVKLTQRQMGEISTKVDKQLKNRSQWLCERCRAARAVQRAHLIRRGQLNWKTTVNELAHLCLPCHKFIDESGEPGRAWSEQFRNQLLRDKGA
jgi:predicted RNA-binding protein YlxR (DUF448 family)